MIRQPFILREGLRIWFHCTWVKFITPDLLSTSFHKFWKASFDFFSQITTSLFCYFLLLKTTLCLAKIKNSEFQIFVSNYSFCLCYRFVISYYLLDRSFTEPHNSFMNRAKLYIPSTLNIDIILWHPQLIMDAMKC